MTLSGTKTWIDPTTTTHTNADEITLNVSRRSGSMTSAEDLTQATGNGSFDNNGDPVDGTYIVVWTDEDNDGYAETYNIYWYFDTEAGEYVGLPVYDSAGYDYRYTVTETINDSNYSDYETEPTWSVDETDSTIVTFDFTNRAPDEPEETPKKSAETNNTDGKVSVGDQITYSISYTNNTNDVVTVTVTDELEDGLTFVSSTSSCSVAGESTGTDSNGSPFNYGGTVTWTISDVQPFTSGYVTVTVQVNENARTLVGTEDTATVNNTASVQIGDNPSVNTNTVTTELEDDPEEDPEKTLASVYADNEEKTNTDYVSVGDVLCYTISYKNHYNATSTITITDVLDTGVDFYFGSNNAQYDSTSRTVTWTLTAQAYEEGYVYLYVIVNENAKATTNDYDVSKSGNTLTYGTGTDTTASVANEASVAVADNEATYTNVVDTPLEPDDPKSPEKTEVTIGGTATSDPTKTTSGSTTTYDYGSVDVGSVIEYKISYYNNNNTAATVIIEDELDEGVQYVEDSATGVTGDDINNAYTKSLSEGGQANYVTYQLTAETTTESVWNENTQEYEYVTTTRVTKITWTIYNVTALTEGYVEFDVLVTEDAIVAGATENTVENDAGVTIGTANAANTNIVVNDVDDEPADPTKTVSPASEAGKDNAAVSAGDKLTYTIEYYNNLGTSATVTITDELDSDVKYVSSSNGGVYDSDTHTVTWTIEDVSAYTTGTVTLKVKVKSGATGTITNIANVQIADGETQETVSTTDTNEVSNTISTSMITTTSSKSSSPKTGDSFRLMLWVLLLAGSAAGLLALYFRRKNSDDAE